VQPQPLLTGRYIILEPLLETHSEALALASSENPALYQWSAVPQGIAAMSRYVASALKARDEGTAVPFATVRKQDGKVIGATRLWNLERWSWPAEHPREGNPHPDVCEIGYTWLSQSAVRTGANTEAKLLMLTHAFETWSVLSTCLHTDARNAQSRTAIERIGGKLDGILRAHRMAVDFTPRDSARYSIIQSEWPAVKQYLQNLLQ
jgi:N-acetyltransferase